MQTKPYLTVMFIDIIESTKLFTRLDDEDVAEIFQKFSTTCTQIIESHHGLVNQTMGDGVYAVFGLDSSVYEHQAFLACLAAKEIISNIQKGIDVKISIHSGYTIITNKGIKHNNPEVPMVGEVIHIAAHNCKKAEPNKIIITEDCFEQVKDNITCKKVSDFVNKNGDVKNIFELEAINDPSNKFGHRKIIKEILVGRASELDTLKKMAMLSFSDRSKHAHIEGEAGIGKTSLISNLLYELRNKYDNLKVISFSSLPYSYTENNDIDDFFYQIETIEKLESTKKQHAQTLLTRRIKHLGLLSKTYPIVLIFDDVHWNKDHQDRLLSLLEFHMDKGRYFLITSSRKEFHLKPKYKFERIILNRLKKEDAFELINSHLQHKRRAKGMEDEICRLSSCNPYYALKIIDHLNRLPELSERSEFRLPDTLDAFFNFLIH